MLDLSFAYRSKVMHEHVQIDPAKGEVTLSALPMRNQRISSSACRASTYAIL